MKYLCRDVINAWALNKLNVLQTHIEIISWTYLTTAGSWQVVFVTSVCLLSWWPTSRLTCRHNPSPRPSLPTPLPAPSSSSPGHGIHSCGTVGAVRVHPSSHSQQSWSVHWFFSWRNKYCDITARFLWSDAFQSGVVTETLNGLAALPGRNCSGFDRAILIICVLFICRQTFRSRLCSGFRSLSVSKYLSEGNLVTSQQAVIKQI